MKGKKKTARTLIAAGMAVALCAGTAFASVGSARVTADSLRLRSGAGTGTSTLAYAPKNTVVELLGTEENGWYQVSYRDLTGYMSAQWLDVTLTRSEADEQPAADAAAPETAGGEPSAAPTEEATPTEETAPAQAVDPVVTADSLNVRSGPGTDYPRIGSLVRGNKVTILSTEGDWYYISMGDVTGYVSAAYISLDGSMNQSGLITGGPLNVRSSPGTGYSRIGSLKQGSIVTVHSTENGWCKISSGSLSGYVSASYVTILGNVGESTLGAAAAAMAVSLLGCRYVYGATGPTSFDCSGLSYYIYRQLGHPISRGSSQQYNNDGSFVPLSQVQPGDLIFIFDPRFDGSGGRLPTTHMGIYVGDGKFIHASTTSYRVQYDNLYGSYYTPYIVGAKRIV